LIAKKARFYVIDAYQVAKDTGMGSRMNTIMQVCFFAISKVLPRDEAIEAIRESIRHTYGRKGEEVVQKNMKAVDETLAHLHEVKIPSTVTSKSEIPAPFPGATKFERDVLGTIYAGRGDELPVSAFSCDGTFPTGTAKWEKRNLALEIPAWDSKICIQCGKCAMVCPHAVIRIKVYDSNELKGAPATFKSCDARDKEWAGMKYTIQVAPEDCTGCGVDATNLASQLQSAGISWKAYMEGMPRPCFTGATSGEYAKKHDPFVYFRAVIDDPAACQRIVPLSQLAVDERSGTLPRFIWITPNLCHDMHDCSVYRGDRFLAGLIPPLLAALGRHGLLFLTWDEGSSDAGCCTAASGGHVAMIVAGESSKKWLEDLNAKAHLEIPLTYFRKGPKDPAARVYNLNPAVTNTFLVTADRSVTANVSDIGPEQFNRVAAATSAMLAGVH